MRTPDNIEFIAVHCSATTVTWSNDYQGQAAVDELTRWHVEGNGWRALGYNEVIDRDGRVYPGRDLDGDGDLFEEVGAHIKGKNKIAYGICLIGGHGSSANDTFRDHFTPEQEAATLAARCQPGGTTSLPTRPALASMLVAGKTTGRSAPRARSQPRSRRRPVV
jgi:hypothetical protein